MYVYFSIKEDHCFTKKISVEHICIDTSKYKTLPLFGKKDVFLGL